MRHRKQGKKFGRTSSHKKAMLKNMSTSLIHHTVIKTTLPKAKELRSIFEPLITLSKRYYKLRKEIDLNANEFRHKSVALRRQAFNFLRNKSATTKLFEEFGELYADRPGGYTKILKCGYRFGDKAPMAFIELVDKPQSKEKSKVEEVFEEK